MTGATWSPDGQRVIFAQFWRRPNERSSGADLMIANADGSDAHPFAERDAPNTVLETPEWLPSGNVYYTIRRVVNGREIYLGSGPGVSTAAYRDRGLGYVVTSDLDEDALTRLVTASFNR